MMTFQLEHTEHYGLSRIPMQFAPFLDSWDNPSLCRISFLERPKNLLQNKTRFKKVGDHSFYLLDDGVMVANATTFVVVKNNFTDMDVYLPPGGKVVEQQLGFLMLQGYRYILANRGQFQMHSAVVIKDGYGIAFCGLPGAGKSTQAHLWEEHLQAEPLNLDQPCIFFREDKVLVSGSPWSGKEDCYKNLQVPLKAIFFVEQATENVVQRLSMAEGYSNLFLNNFLVPINHDIEKKHQSAILKVTSSVPMYRLQCTISKEAVKAAYDAIF